MSLSHRSLEEFLTVFFLARGADVNTSKRNSDTPRGHEFASLAFWGILVSDTSNEFAEKFESPVDSLEMLRDGLKSPHEHTQSDL